MFQIDIENDNDLYVFYTKITETKKHENAYHAAINIRSILNKFDPHVNKLIYFVQNTTKKGSFTLLCKDEDRNEFALFRIEEGICDEIETKDEIDIEGLFFKGGKLIPLKVSVLTTNMKHINLMSRTIGVNDDPEAIEKMLNSDTKYTCASCGKMAKKMSRCTKCKMSYYCNRECQKKNWKLHKRICKNDI